MLADLGTRQLREGLAWTDIAPMIACYDLDMALELAGVDPMAVADVLVAAAASGAGQAAYTFAANQAQDFDRTLYLLATVIGLRHAKLAADPSLPCATVTVIANSSARARAPHIAAAAP